MLETIVSICFSRLAQIRFIAAFFPGEVGLRLSKNKMVDWSRVWLYRLKLCLAWPLLAVPLFGLLRIRVTDEASKRAVHAFACRAEPMPLAVDCSRNTKRRSFLVLCPRPGQTPLSVC